MNQREHWEAIHARRRPEDASWYRPHLDRSLLFIDQAGLARDAPILDVGGGGSTLVADLLERGYSNVTLLDISENAIQRARTRLGARAAQVTWLTGDITTIELQEHHYEFWHDRAVFHFLTDPGLRQQYVTAVRHALKPDGHLLVATFGPSGPEQCSGLSIVRYSAEGIRAEFGSVFRKVGDARETHLTPRGVQQEFVYCYCRRCG